MPDEADLIAAEHARRDAIMRDDADALDAMTAGTFHYAHINGMVEDRGAYLARIRSGAVRIPHTGARDLVATLRPGYALLSGVSHIDYAWTTGAAGSIETLFLSVWEVADGRWKIAAYASTPMPGGG